MQGTRTGFSHHQHPSDCGTQLVVGSGAGAMEASLPLCAIPLGYKGWFSWQRCSGAWQRWPRCVLDALHLLRSALGLAKAGVVLASMSGIYQQSPKPSYPSRPSRVSLQVQVSGLSGIPDCFGTPC